MIGHPAYDHTPIDLRTRITAPVTIAGIDVLCRDDVYLIRARATDGTVGLAMPNQHLPYLLPLLCQRVIPTFIGRDARDVPALIDAVYRDGRNYKLVGVPFWSCVGYVELALFDLLGHAAGISVGALLGGVIRHEVPVYLSSLRRDTTPEDEVARLAERVAVTGARAIKVKIGGRMSGNADVQPGRSERVIALARAVLGDAVTIYADANGSYDAETALTVGAMLRAYGVALLEEPCPFEDYAATRRVADALEIPIGGGEQDTSLYRFADLAATRAVDVLQPDVNYVGGLVRAIAIADIAARHGLPLTPHNPSAGPRAAAMLHLIARTPHAGPFQEFAADPAPAPGWYTPVFTVDRGAVAVPTGPGLGITYDPAFLATMRVVAA